MSNAPRISRPVSVAVVVLCLWLVGTLGFTVVLRLTGPHLFPPTEDFKPLIMMLGGFYGLRVASQLLAVGLASVVIAHSRFARPYYVLAAIVGGYHLVGVLLRWTLRRPAWESVSGSAPALAFLFEVGSALALAGVATLFLSVYARLSARSYETLTHG